MTDSEESPNWESAKQLIEAAQAEGFSDSHSAQAEVVYSLAQLPYSGLISDHQQYIISNLVDRLPRFENFEKKARTLDAILRLQSYEDVSRALKVRPQPLDFPMEPEESRYPSGKSGGWIGDFIFWARQSKVPFGFLFWSAVSAIGSACRFNYYFDYGVKNFRLNEYIILIGMPASGKTLGMDAALEVMQRANKYLSDDSKIQILPEDTTVQNLTKRMAYHTVEEVTGDIVTEIGFDSTGILALDEIATFLGKSTYDLGRRIPWVTTIYGKDEYEHETMEGGSHVLKNLAFSILACGALEWLKNSVTPDLFNKGFMDRTLFIHREKVTCRAYPIPAPQDPVVAEELASWLVELSKRQPRVEMMPTESGLKWYEEWYYEKNKKPEPLWGHHHTSVERQSIHLWKLASIMALSHKEAPWISEVRFKEASKYMSMEREHFKHCMEMVDRAPDLDREDYLMEVLKRLGAGSKWVLKSVLMPNIRGKKIIHSLGNKLALQVLDDLQSAGFIEIDRGRPTRYRFREKGRGK